MYSQKAGNYDWLSGFLDQSIPVWREDPVVFFREVLKFYPDDWQAEAARDLAASPMVSIRSGQGVGKTGLEAACFLWFLTCFPYPRVVATAPTKQQLHDVLWSEISKWMSRSPLLQKLLKWTKTYVYMVGNEKRWFGVARTATKPENMQSFHEDNMLFIVDEASGVADPIMEAILGTLSGANNKLLMCGNPTRTSGTFYDSHTRDRNLYKLHKVSSLDSIRTNKDNIQSIINKYGMNSNVVRVRVLGEFPDQEDDVFIPFSLVMRSVETDYEPKAAPEVISIGCDVARYGDDKTVIGYRIDEKVLFYKKRNGQDTMKTADDIIELSMMLEEKYHPSESISVKIDDSGVGGGVTDRLRQLKRLNSGRFDYIDIFPVHFGQKIKHKFYDDSTTYMMSVVKNLLQPHDEDGNEKPVEVILPNDNDLIGQLSGRKYAMLDNGKLRVENKKAMKARGLPSPDEADCVLLVCLPVIRKKRKEGNGKA